MIGSGELELCFDRGAQTGEWCAELVRDVGAERSLSGDEVIEARRGRGHRHGRLVDLRDITAWHVEGEVAVAQSHGGVSQIANGAGEASGNHIAERCSDGHDTDGQ